MAPYAQINDVGYTPANARRVMTSKPVLLSHCSYGIYQHIEHSNDMKDKYSDTHTNTHTYTHTHTHTHTYIQAYRDEGSLNPTSDIS